MGKRAWNSNFSGGMGKRAWNSGFAGAFFLYYIRNICVGRENLRLVYLVLYILDGILKTVFEF